MKRRRCALVAGAVLTACSAVPELAPTSGVPMYRIDPQAGGMMALLSGDLQLVDGCLVVSAGEEDIAILWPVPTTTWRPEERTIHYGDQRLQLGDPVEIGGGHVDIKPRPDLDWVAQPNEACFAQDGWWMAAAR
jgi:hypothetical protein